MGSSVSTEIKSHELIAFKKLPSETLLETIDIPERPANRKPTDQRFLIAFFSLVILLIPFLIYTLIHADTRRFMVGYVNSANTRYEKWNCSSSRKYITDTPIPYDIDDILSYLSKEKWIIALLCLIPLSISLGSIVLLRYGTHVMVWISIVLLLISFTAFVGFSWFYFAFAYGMGGSMPMDFLYFCIIITIGLLALICIIISLKNKVVVFIDLLQEAMIAVYAMPQLLLVPVLTLIAILIVLALSATAFVYMTTSAVLTEYEDGRFIYQHNIAMYFTQALNLVVTIWTVQFILGIQYMIISGTVAKRYFSKNKKYLDSPLLTSAYVTFRFHLGTIAFGSTIISLVSMVRGLLSIVVLNCRGTCLRTLARSCLRMIETFLIVFSKDAYILTAMHGKPLYKSGKRAAGIVFENAIDVLSIQFISGFIFFILHLMSIILLNLIPLFREGLLIGFGEYEHLIIVVPISLVVSTTFFSLCESAINTTFLCLCEDRLLNDGMDRPYAMTTSLTEFMNRARIIFREWR